MEVKPAHVCPPGYKQSEAGVIPKDWDIVDLGTRCTQVTTGKLDVNAMTLNGQYRFYTCARNWYYIDTYAFDTEALLISGNGANVGYIHYYNGKFNAYQRTYVLSGFVDSVKYIQQYLGHKLSDRIRVEVNAGNTPYITRGTLTGMKVAIPSTMAEQKAIAEVLDDVDALIAALDRLIAKKRDIKQGAMQELLTGKTRLPGFSGEWVEKQIADIAIPSPEKNNSAEPLPVLTCSKHVGFVDSLSFFKNQVFSSDTRNYKVIKRGQIGYPSNHVEEGSIGLQDLYDVALVSPIYVVFSVSKEVDSYLLHRLLKLDSYRQKFAASTSSSVDRRGSLRWPAFSAIKVKIPPIDEQTAITHILIDIEAEIFALVDRLTKTRALKQGMIHELLTGKTRLL